MGERDYSVCVVIFTVIFLSFNPRSNQFVLIDIR